MDQAQANVSKRSFSLPFSFFAGPVFWMLQIFIGYGLSAQACLAGSKALEYILGAAVVLIVLVSAFLAYRNWRGYARGRQSLTDTQANIGSNEWVSLAGALLSTMFLLPILMTSIGIIFLSPCPIISMPLP
jgi:hypothetical protein